MIGLIYGYDLGSIATAILFLTDDFQLTAFQISVVTTAVVVGQLVGAFFAGRITNRFGRKNSMIFVALGYAAFTGLQGLAPNEWFLTGVRFLLGFIIGVSIVTAPAYIAESAPKSIRGSMLVTFQIATVSGICIAYFVGLALSGTESWRLILSLAAIPALIVLFLVLRLPETARGLMMMGRRAEAVEVLRRVDPDVDPEEEADIIERDLSYEEQGSLSELFRGRFRRAGTFVVGLGFLVQITGINAIVYYSPTIVQQVGVESSSGAILVTAIIQLFAVAAVVGSFFLVDRLGRRPILLGGITAMGIASAMLVVAFATGPSPVLAIIGILLFTMAFNFGYGALVWAYASESFPRSAAHAGRFGHADLGPGSEHHHRYRVPQRARRVGRSVDLRHLRCTVRARVRLRVHFGPGNEGTPARGHPRLLVQRWPLAGGGRGGYRERHGVGARVAGIEKSTRATSATMPAKGDSL